METVQLVGKTLDWAVAKASGAELYRQSDYLRLMAAQADLPDGAAEQEIARIVGRNDDWIMVGRYGHVSDIPEYSRKWSAGGPVIEGNDIALDHFVDYPKWAAQMPETGYIYGNTPLEAAMRAFVVGKLGAEVDVPVDVNAG